MRILLELSTVLPTVLPPNINPYPQQYIPIQPIQQQQLPPPSTATSVSNEQTLISFD